MKRKIRAKAPNEVTPLSLCACFVFILPSSLESKFTATPLCSGLRLNQEKECSRRVNWALIMLIIDRLVYVSDSSGQVFYFLPLLNHVHAAARRKMNNFGLN